MMWNWLIMILKQRQKPKQNRRTLEISSKALLNLKPTFPPFSQPPRLAICSKNVTKRRLKTNLISLTLPIEWKTKTSPKSARLPTVKRYDQLETLASSQTKKMLHTKVGPLCKTKAFVKIYHNKLVIINFAFHYTNQKLNRVSHFNKFYFCNCTPHFFPLIH